jgi:hypothetical protein
MCPTRQPASACPPLAQRRLAWAVGRLSFLTEVVNVGRLLNDELKAVKEEYVRYWQPDLRSVRKGEWLMFDGAQRVAILREVEIGPQKEKLIRSVTWDAEVDRRVLLGYFPHLRLGLLAARVGVDTNCARRKACGVVGSS